MKIYKMKKTNLKRFLSRLLEFAELWGPRNKGSHHTFERIHSPTEIDLDYSRTQIPVKKLFFPPKMKMVEYNFDEMTSMERAQKESIPHISEKKAIFGVHPCDINALNIQDEFFLEGNYEDPYYQKLRSNTIIIGHSCLPDPNCLCNNTGTSDVTKGFDLFFSELRTDYLVWIASSIGNEIVLNNLDLFSDQVDEDDRMEFNSWSRERSQMFSHTFDLPVMPKLMELNYDHEMWEELGEECLSCGTCTLVCPTCSCYDVIDTLQIANTGQVVRLRMWDSCHYPEYSEVAGGINFRPSRSSRLKLYYTHKLDSYKGEIDYPTCVGCGRCVQFCPVDINILRITEKLAELRK